ncbi:MAG: hypothetical protein JJT88_19150 [Gammaproteobacteria bacterium]|nr:hypothetical protein [Gammaproteobacteria bacterium]
MNHKRKLLALAVATGISAMPMLGSAAVTFVAAENDSIFGGLTALSFESTGVAPFCGPYASCSGDYAFRTGSVLNETKAPGTDSGTAVLDDIFLTVPRSTALPAQATFDFGYATNSFGMLWGSVDSYNLFEFLLNGSIVGSVSGTQVANSVGVTATTNTGNFNIDRFVRFDGVGSTEFDSIRFRTTNFGFETEFHHVAEPTSVPGPMPMALFALGLAGIGLFGKRREIQS